MHVRRAAVFAVATVIIGSPLLAGCSTAPRTVIKSVPGPTVTVTMTVPGPTATVTRTVRVRVTTTATPVAAPVSTPQPVATSSAAVLPDAASFDRGYAMTVARETVQDIKTVDHRLKDGIAVSAALYLLSDDYGRLSDAGVPPGVVASTYMARLNTLGSFASTAADEYDADPMQGSARYAVVRKETGPLFRQLNSAIGTQFALP